ncbi:hypothetical protein MUK42_05318 [Musa troglodytarum]|uniref:Uncharacterized protein n=1 Tax=Musa troglodytarum TaxID=320322 RepID=A0A9E7GI51_9LILI|nr:hypothetical protein MUK42_05318 [Musa troglodytarum]
MCVKVAASSEMRAVVRGTSTAWILQDVDGHLKRELKIYILHCHSTSFTSSASNKGWQGNGSPTHGEKDKPDSSWQHYFTANSFMLPDPLVSFSLSIA